MKRVRRSLVVAFGLGVACPNVLPPVEQERYGWRRWPHRDLPGPFPFGFFGFVLLRGRPLRCSLLRDCGLLFLRPWHRKSKELFQPSLDGTAARRLRQRIVHVPYEPQKSECYHSIPTLNGGRRTMGRSCCCGGPASRKSKQTRFINNGHGWDASLPKHMHNSFRCSDLHATFRAIKTR